MLQYILIFGVEFATPCIPPFVTLSACRAVRLLPEGEDGRRQPDSQVEEAGVREPLLSALHSDAGHQLRHQLHLPRAESQTGGGQFTGDEPLVFRDVISLIHHLVHGWLITLVGTLVWLIRRSVTFPGNVVNFVDVSAVTRA